MNTLQKSSSTSCFSHISDVSVVEDRLRPTIFMSITRIVHWTRRVAVSVNIRRCSERRGWYQRHSRRLATSRQESTQANSECRVRSDNHDERCRESDAELYLQLSEQVAAVGSESPHRCCPLLNNTGSRWTFPILHNNNRPNNNNNHDNVYGAIVMTKVIARVHPVHLMNVD